MSESDPWFFGAINRTQTEKYLSASSDGVFLVRNSTNFPGDLVLSVSCNGTVEHYRICVSDLVVYVDEESQFRSLRELIRFYSNSANGLCTRLTRHCINESVKSAELPASSISPEKLKLFEKLGQGEFADVFRAELDGFGVAAVKILKGVNESNAKEFLNEAYVMSKLRHCNLVHFIGTVVTEKRSDENNRIFTFQLVTEYMANGNLADYLRSKGRHVTSPTMQLQFALDIASGMNYLENSGIVHRDLAARNVLLNSDCSAKISDLGMARLGHKSEPSSLKLPIKWTAPEALHSGHFNTASDVWSFGVVLWEIMSYGRLPYPRISVTDVMVYLDKGYRMEPPEQCDPEIYKLMLLCWSVDPDHRPTFAKIHDRLVQINQNILSYDIFSPIIQSQGVTPQVF